MKSYDVKKSLIHLCISIYIFLHEIYVSPKVVSSGMKSYDVKNT